LCTSSPHLGGFCPSLVLRVLVCLALLLCRFCAVVTVRIFCISPAISFPLSGSYVCRYSCHALCLPFSKHHVHVTAPPRALVVNIRAVARGGAARLEAGGSPRLRGLAEGRKAPRAFYSALSAFLVVIYFAPFHGSCSDAYSFGPVLFLPVPGVCW